MSFMEKIVNMRHSHLCLKSRDRKSCFDEGVTHNSPVAFAGKARNDEFIDSIKISSLLNVSHLCHGIESNITITPIKLEEKFLHTVTLNLNSIFSLCCFVNAKGLLITSLRPK